MQAKTWWVSEMSWLNYLNPLDWPSDLSNSFISQLEGGAIYLLTVILNAFLGIFNTVFGWLMTAFEGVITLLVNSAIASGPFALPVFSIGITLILGGAYVVFGGLKDVPIVGSVV